MIWLIVIIPVLIAICAKFFLRLDICWKEFAIQVVAGIAAVSLIWAIGSFVNTSDVETWNGGVISKAVDRERCYTNMVMPRVCSRSYDCNCYTVCTPTTDSKGNVTGQSCTTHCDTCYRYKWEQDWNVKTSLGNYTISRVDSQGANEPARYTSVNVGDPVSKNANYQNWLKASKDTLFKDAASIAEKYADRLPAYPNKIYDYYRVNRAVQVGVRLPQANVWNEEISKALVQLGPKKEMNLVFVFANNVDNDYPYAVRYHWDGLKKNDMVVFVGLRNNVITWSETLSWSKNPAVEVRAREYMNAFVGKNINELKPVDTVQAIKYIADKDFERRPMEDFEYLRGDIKPPLWLVIFAIVFAIGSGVGLSILFHRNELFPKSTSSYNSYRRYYS